MKYSNANFVHLHKIVGSFIETDENPIRLGGEEIIFEADESCFWHNNSKQLQRANISPDCKIWVFGMVDTSTKKQAIGFMKIVEKKDEGS
ncbi:hypothetical protein DERP_007268 [Dermatophagoides pteronyssinus]|uniref:Uncharacterized protein n=1 Tax=Dermatophagoides pteronyssinus TaxID=6956 RepID=A0ABQ8J3Z8_DERPT|nr:hypothetical protein DERP_007268 [Dermatophagoides pteronyssinus]